MCWGGGGGEGEGPAGPPAPASSRFGKSGWVLALGDSPSGPEAPPSREPPSGLAASQGVRRGRGVVTGGGRGGAETRRRREGGATHGTCPAQRSHAQRGFQGRAGSGRLGQGSQQVFRPVPTRPRSLAHPITTPNSAAQQRKNPKNKRGIEKRTIRPTLVVRLPRQPAALALQRALRGAGGVGRAPRQLAVGTLGALVDGDRQHQRVAPAGGRADGVPALRAACGRAGGRACRAGAGMRSSAGGRW